MRLVTLNIIHLLTTNEYYKNEIIYMKSLSVSKCLINMYVFGNK